MTKRPFTIEDAINRLYLRAEIASEAAVAIGRPDFEEQAESFLTIAGLLERVRQQV
jgi:hypothetical protein